VSMTVLGSFLDWHRSAVCWGAVLELVRVSLAYVLLIVTARKNVVERLVGLVGPVEAVRIRVGGVSGPSGSWHLDV
jgi:hypothetical protein